MTTHRLTVQFLPTVIKAVGVTSLIASLCLLGPSARAGEGTQGHGGNAVFCPQRPPVVLDYYHSTLGTLGGPADIVDISAMTKDQVIQFFVNRLAGTYFQTQIRDALSALGPVESWISADLKSIDDSAEPYVLPAGCVRKTAAIRQNETDMFIDLSVAGVLSPAQLGVLVIHEAAYYFGVKNAGLQDSSKVRTLVRALLQRTPSQNDIDAAIRGLGGVPSKGYGFDLLAIAPNTYFSTPVDGYYEGYQVTSIDPAARTFQITHVTQSCMAFWSVRCELDRSTCWGAWTGFHGSGCFRWPNAPSLQLRVASTGKSFTMTYFSEAPSRPVEFRLAP
jgi:hypothetical protein